MMLRYHVRQQEAAPQDDGSAQVVEETMQSEKNKFLPRNLALQELLASKSNSIGQLDNKS